MKSTKNRKMEKYQNYFINEENEYDFEFETRMIMYRFLSIVDEKMEELDMSKKELAELIGTSASYITQLFNGNKIVNLPTLAKFQKALNINFKVRDENSNVQINEEDIESYIKNNIGKDFFVVYSRSREPEYNQSSDTESKDNNLFIQYA